MSQIDEKETVLSAYQAPNEIIFPRILSLYVDAGDTIADVTYGKGVFWNNVDADKYNLLASDIDESKSPCGESIDARDLPYDDDSIDVVVADPPYSSGYYRKDSSRTADGGFGDYYGVPDELDVGDLPKYHAAVRAMYAGIGREARRVLVDGGVLIVKTMDEVVANKNRFTHTEVQQDYEKIGFEMRDLFVVMRENKPSMVNTQNQVHARKNHSYFLVFEL